MDYRYQLYGGQSYAQYGDDFIVLNLFHWIGVSSPSYLDIGAHHPFELSNTALLYKRECRGINVEADPELIGQFHKHRPTDINLNVGVAAASGSREFYRCRTSGRSSFVREIVEPHGIAKIVTVPVMTVNEIYEKHGVKDFLSIDAEGLDYEILASLDVARFAPKVICVEAASFVKDSAEMMSDLMAGRGYFLCFRACANMFFVKNEYRERMFSI